MADDPPEDVSKRELWQRLRRLEQAVFPDRRDVLKAGAGAAAGGVAGALLTGGAAAGTAEAGTIGTAAKPQDVYAEDLYDKNDNRALELPGSGGVDILNDLSIGGNQALLSRAGSGQQQLSSGAAVVDTGLSASDATFYLALGVDDPGADAKIAGRLFWDDSAGTYKIELVETDTSVGNPTVNYDILRVR